MICNSRHDNTKVSIFPFYGGGKGQSLQVVEKPDGTVIMTIIKTPPPTTTTTEAADIISEVENPPLPSKNEEKKYGNNIRNIHHTALNIIKLQDIAKRNGKLSAEEEETYKANMEVLNASAKNLANIQQQEEGIDFENREGLSEWFERKKSHKKDKDKKKKDEDKKKDENDDRKTDEDKRKEMEAEEEKKRKEKEEAEEEKKRKEKEEEEEVGEQEEGPDDGDSVAINLPPEGASVAEARPIGLAVAGEGGVAASKPIATAVVGPGGLAIARPVGTAIAGVAPDQALVPIYAEGYIGGSKPKRYGSSSAKSDPASEYLNKIINKYHQN